MNETRRRIAWLVLGFLALFLCTSCGLRTATGSDAGASADTGTHPIGGPLVVLGHWCIYLGGIALILDALAEVLLFVYASPLVTRIGPFLGKIAVIGACAILVGSGLVWIGVHAWVLFILGALAIAFVCVRHRAFILHMLDLDPKSLLARAEAVASGKSVV